MPFNIWCGGCNSMIAKGVRFNAEKKQVGNYYSTKVSFLTDCISYSVYFNLFELVEEFLCDLVLVNRDLIY